MAQGTIKPKKATSATAKSSGRRQAVLGPKKGARTIAPRRQVLVKNQKMIKVCPILSPLCLYFLPCAFEEDDWGLGSAWLI
jgi:hypothetical protein